MNENRSVWTEEFNKLQLLEQSLRVCNDYYGDIPAWLRIAHERLMKSVYGVTE